MFRRRGARATARDRKPTDDERIGIGALVYVVSAPDGRDEWEGEPSGVVIAPGDNEIAAYPGISMGRLSGWLVAFDELAYMADGRGPFEQATVPGARLRLIPSPPADPSPAAEA